MVAGTRVFIAAVCCRPLIFGECGECGRRVWLVPRVRLGLARDGAFLVAVVFCGSNRDGWFFKVPGRCRTLNGSIEGSGVYGSHSGSFLLRVASYGYVPPAARLTYFMFHFTAPIAPTPMPTTSRLVFPRLILQRARLWLNQRPVAGSSA